MDRFKLIEIYAEGYKEDEKENNWEEEFLTDEEIASMFPPTQAELELDEYERPDNNSDERIKMAELEDIIAGLDKDIDELKMCIEQETGNYYSRMERQEELRELTREHYGLVQKLRDLQDEYEGRSRKLR